MAACTGGDDPELSGDDGSTTAFVPKPVIALVVNDWTASALNVSIAEQLIERHLAYPVVPTRLDNTTQIYEGLADGSLDAVLEVWPSAITERDQRFFDRDDVVDLGPLGPIGKVGWFVPGYVVEGDPQLSGWEGFASAGVAAQFATPETTPKGRFLGTSADYRQNDEEIIDRLNLPFEVVFSDSEEATMAELAASHAAAEPILLYWWTPTAAVARYDLVNVELPARTEECAAAETSGVGAVDCDYQEDVLFKVSSIELATKAPDVLDFLRSFTLSQQDQLDLLVAVEIDGVSVADAAATWIEANEGTWRPWLGT